MVSGSVVLAYHEIMPPTPGCRRSLVVSPATFARHLRMLRALRVSIVTPAQIGNSLRSGAPLPRRAICLTFDDGYIGNYRYALPALADQGFTAIVYVPSRLLGRKEPGTQPPFDTMTADQLRQWIATGNEIGAHTRTHPDLTTLDPEQLEGEIAGSRADLERLLGQPVTSFCYPSGRYTNEVVSLVASSGYTTACTTAPGRVGPSTEPFLLPRLSVGNDPPARLLAYNLLRLWAA